MRLHELTTIDPSTSKRAQGRGAVRTVVSSNKTVAILALELPVDVLFGLLERNVHVAGSCSGSEGVVGVRPRYRWECATAQWSNCCPKKSNSDLLWVERQVHGDMLAAMINRFPKQEAHRKAGRCTRTHQDTQERLDSPPLS